MDASAPHSAAAEAHADAAAAAAPGVDVGAAPPDGRHCYAAVIENRAKEVGIATLDVSSLTLRISQHIEAGRSYMTTQLLLDAWAPKQVVIVGSQHHEVSGGVNAAIAAGWDHALLLRSCFDDTKGILAVQEATGWSPDGAAAKLSTAAGGNGGSGAGSRALLKSHYLGFGAAGALLHHLRFTLKLVLTPRAVQVEFAGIHHHMSLDRDVVTSLELLAPSRARAALQKALAKSSSSSASRSRDAAAAAAAVAGDAQGASGFAASYGDGSRGRRGGGRGGRQGWRQQGGAASSVSRRSSSLFGFLDHASTACGARLLRTNLLQPLTDITTLDLRLDSLQELLESPHLSLELVGLMDTLPKNLDKVCSNLAIRASGGSGSSSSGDAKDLSASLGRLVSSVILLRDVLRCLPAMADSMAWVDSQLLRAIRANFAHKELQQLLASVEAVLDDDAQASKTQFINRVQQCFAVRATVDSFLDISRGTFSRLTESIHELAAKYRESTGIAGLKVQYSSSRGFYLVVPSSSPPAATASAWAAHGGAATGSNLQQQGPPLPKSFLVLEKQGRNTVWVTTHELNALNSRLRDAAADCMLLTVQVLEDLVARLLARMPLLLRVLDNIALLDMLLAFFQAVGGSDGAWCRPSFSESAPLAVVGGRHPLLLAMSSGSGGRECVANDTYVSPAATLHLVTGPNMSGKSTYLKQVALLVVLAQVGCYVPASHMSLPPYASLHTRIGTSDSIEANASSFMVEMADMAHVMERASSRSLVLIDELGRATSTADGAALCWAMSEYLLALGAHTLLATHLRQLEGLAAIYPTARLWRMQVAVSGSDIDFSWSIAPDTPAAAAAGPAPAAAANNTSHYGILLGRMAGLPPSICAAALAVAQQLDAQQQEQGQQGFHGDGSSDGMHRLRQVYCLVHKLGCVAREAAAGHGKELGVQAAEAAGLGSADTAAAAALQRCLPVLKQLQRQAEQMLLTAAREPQARASQGA